MDAPGFYRLYPSGKDIKRKPHKQVGYHHKLKSRCCAMFKLPVQTRIKKVKIPIRLNYLFSFVSVPLFAGSIVRFISIFLTLPGWSVMIIINR